MQSEKKDESNEDVDKYYENEAKEFFASREEYELAEANMYEKLDNIRNDCKITGQAKYFQLDQPLESKEINANLTYVLPHEDKERIKYLQKKYPESHAETNFQAFI